MQFDMKRILSPTTAVIPCPVILLSVAGQERPNIITVSWVANVCSRPPTVAVGIRPERHSHELISAAGEFVLNVPTAEQLEATVFCGTKSGRDHDKFEECNLTPLASSQINSPLIAECPINIECRVKETVNLGAHNLVIAEVLAVHIDEALLDSNGNPDLTHLHLFTYIPLTGEYWGLGKPLR